MRIVQVEAVLNSTTVHLARRFFGFLSARPLTPEEQSFVAANLSSELQRAFFMQRTEDQRHGVDVASRALRKPTVVEAALLHDVGKTASPLGAVGRAFATVWTTTSLPVWGNWRIYLDHGRIGAEIIESNGGSALAVAFARHHPGDPPPWIDPGDWASLAEADEV